MEKEYYLFTDRKWLVILGGYLTYIGRSNAAKRLAWIYHRIVVPIFILGSIVSFVAGAIFSTDKNDIVLTAHFAIIFTAFLFAYFTRFATESDFNEAVENIRSGLYTYFGGEWDSQMEAIQSIGLKNMRSTLMMFSKALVGWFILFCVLRPIFIFFIGNGDAKNKPVNPCIMMPLYVPFDTTNNVGFVLVNLLASVPSFYTVLAAICVEETYIGATSNIMIQLKLLNYSVSVIQRRAYSRLKKAKDIPVDEDIFGRKDFQDCMYACLRENVRHHQKIIRAYVKMRTYIGLTLLILAVLASGVLAVVGVAILQSLKNRSQMFMVLPYLLLGANEAAFAFRFCYFGEAVATECEDFFRLLYCTPWYLCSEQFKSLLIVMLKNTDHIKMKAPLYNFTASYKSFGEIMNTMYQLLSLARKAAL
nr:olfactory receptor 68 [Tropidothorax elegans]